LGFFPIGWLYAARLLGAERDLDPVAAFGAAPVALHGFPCGTSGLEYGALAIDF
jgi:hypothetical protein